MPQTSKQKKRRKIKKQIKRNPHKTTREMFSAFIKAERNRAKRHGW